MWPAQGVSGGTWSGSISLQESFLRQRSYNSIERLGKSSTIWLVYTRGKGREKSLWDPVVVCVHHKYMQINATEAVKGNSWEPHAGCKILLPEARQAGSWLKTTLCGSPGGAVDPVTQVRVPVSHSTLDLFPSVPRSPVGVQPLQQMTTSATCLHSHKYLKMIHWLLYHIRLK